MKEIKIFLASSEEMDYDRQAFGNLVRRLDNLYEKRGIRVKLFEWEDYDSAYNDRRKQDEYNDRVRESDVFLALFHRKAGSFTVEEFDIASEQFREKASPKVYTFLRNLKPEEVETPELTAFKKRLFEELGHFWCRYENRESLQFQFVMQLQLVESSMQDDLKLEGRDITLEGLRIASIDKMPFASGNEEYMRMNEELSTLPSKIEKSRMRLEKFPGDEDLQDDLQQKLNRYNELKKDLEEYRQLLFDTAKRVAKLQTEKITERLRRAMEAFNEGKVREANIILDEAEADAKVNLAEYKRSRELTEMHRESVIESIEELWFKTSVVMSDISLPIEERVKETDNLFKCSIEMASEITFDKERYITIIVNYQDFLYDYGMFDEALTYAKMVLDLTRKTFGPKHIYVAGAYVILGTIYHEKGLFSKAMYNYKTALRLYNADSDQLRIATVNNNLGCVFHDMGDYASALKCYETAMKIDKSYYGENHPKMRACYLNVGLIYSDLGDYSQALLFCSKALAINELTGQNEDLPAAKCYNNIGSVYDSLGDDTKALEFYEKSLRIREKLLGKVHSETASSLNNIGSLFFKKEQYSKAMEYYKSAMEIFEKVFGVNHPDTATAYSNVGSVYYKMQNHSKALEYAKKSQVIRKRILGPEHPDTVLSDVNLAEVYIKKKDYSKALAYYMKVVGIRNKTLGKNHPDTIASYRRISSLSYNLKDYSTMFEYEKMILESNEIAPGENNWMDLAVSYNNMAFALERLGNYAEALDYYLKALAIDEKELGCDHSYTQSVYDNLGHLYLAIGDKNKAEEFLNKVRKSN